MNKIIEYILNMTPYMLIGLIITIIFRYLKYKKTKNLNWYYEILLVIFITFVIGLISQTIIPKIEIYNNQVIIKYANITRINIMPLKVIIQTYNELLNNNINYLIINLLGNIIMFIPFGFFIPLLFNISNKKVIMIGFLSSLFIELNQLILPRGTDIDDLILNTTGTIIGLIIYKIINKKFKIKEKITKRNSMKFNKLIPELSVSNLKESLKFYQLIGFEIKYERKEDKFIFLELNKNQIMIQENNDNWNTVKLEYPYGRGINISMEVKNIEIIRDILKHHEYKIYKDIVINKYKVKNKQYVDKEFLVQDPDGYLLRFTEE